MTKHGHHFILFNKMRCAQLRTFYSCQLDILPHKKNVFSVAHLESISAVIWRNNRSGCHPLRCNIVYTKLQRAHLLTCSSLNNFCTLNIIFVALVDASSCEKSTYSSRAFRVSYYLLLLYF